MFITKPKLKLFTALGLNLQQEHQLEQLDRQTRQVLGGDIVKDKPENMLINIIQELARVLSLPEHIVLDEERVSGWFEYKVLHEGLGRIVVSLESINHKSVFPWYGLAIGDKRDKTRGRVGFWF